MVLASVMTDVHLEVGGFVYLPTCSGFEAPEPLAVSAGSRDEGPFWYSGNGQ